MTWSIKFLLFLYNRREKISDPHTYTNRALIRIKATTIKTQINMIFHYDYGHPTSVIKRRVRIKSKMKTNLKGVTFLKFHQSYINTDANFTFTYNISFIMIVVLKLKHEI